MMTAGGDRQGCACKHKFDVELRRLLSKLRPFQREAFFFATGSRCEHCCYRDEKGCAKVGDDVAGVGIKECEQNAVSPFRTEKKPGKRLKSKESSRGASHRMGGRILLADEMGLGKTVTSLAIMMAYQSEWPLLILCPASLRYMWPGEIEKFVPSLPSSCIYVVSGFDDADFYSNPQKKNRIKIVIATYSLLQARSAAARVLRQFEFHCVIVDESHHLKERSSQRCQLALPILKGARRLVLISGTPALARPVELWAQLHCLDPATFGSYTAFTKRYCRAHQGRFGWDVKGISNAEELHELLSPLMVRRLKADVLSELPAKQRSIVPIKLDKSKVKECRDTIERLKETRVSIDELVGADAYGAHFEARRLMLDAYQASGIAKAASISDFVLDWLGGSTTQKLLVFGHHKHVLDVIENAVSKKLRGVGHIRIDGTVSPAERSQRIRDFQNELAVRVAILSMTAAGNGLTLTAASTVIFAELHWTPGVLSQAEDRCHRIGQPNAVNVLYCVCKDGDSSLDMELWNMLGRKVGNIGRIIDGNKRASMTAKVSELASGSDKKGISGEDELVRFFAENASNNENCASAQNVPVKGSIQSFFCKKSNVKANRSIGDILSIGGGGIGSASQEDGTYCVTKKESTTFRSPPNAIMEWTCVTCTFINNRSPSADGSRVCLMCGTKKAVDEHGDQSQEQKRKQIGSSDCEAVTCVPSTGGHVLQGAQKFIDLSEKSDLNASSVKDTFSPEKNRNSMCKKHRRRNKASVFSTATPMAMANMTPLPSNVIDLCYKSGLEADSDEDILSFQAFSASDVKRSQKKQSLTEHCAGSFNGSTKVTPSPKGGAKAIHLCNKSKTGNLSHQEMNCSAVTRVSAEGTACVIDMMRSNSEDYSAKSEYGVVCPSMLGFSVSKNSGRISLYVAKTGQALAVNFELSEVLHESISAYMEQSRVTRTSLSQSQCDLIEFNEDGISQLFKRIDDGVLKQAHIPCDPCHFEDEIKRFVTEYVSLREFEKRIVKELNEPVRPEKLRQIIANCMACSAKEACFDRYIGGAKEKAFENIKNNRASEIDRRVIEGMACAWCANPFSDASITSGVEATYCSQRCAEEGRLRRGGMYASTRIREQLFCLEGGKCRHCGYDAHGFYLRIKALHPAERLNALCNANWKLPKSGPALERILQRPKECDFWEADHIRDVSFGGGDCGLENFQTLCIPCHKSKTKRMKVQLLLSRAAVGTATDIRVALHNSTAGIRGRKAKKRKSAD